MHKGFIRIACIFAALAIGLGAFGAHELKKYVSAEMLVTFDTAVRYHFYHTIALFITGIVFYSFPNNWVKTAGITFLLGIILFSGSLYTLTILYAAYSVGSRGIGFITPFGGLFFIAGWLFLLIGIRNKSQSL